MKRISIVIPVFNMGRHLPSLLDSLIRTGLDPLIDEIVIIDDGSTDNTPAMVDAQRDKFPKIRPFRLPRNSGRFVARLKGAEAARSDTILFLDARVVLADDFGPQLQRALERSNFLQPQPRIDVSRNIFCLYWDRSHKALFRRHYAALEKGPVEITAENYDQFLKGTGLLVVPKKIFLEACREVGDSVALSDDTAIMKSMVRRQSMWLIPEAWCWWIPRESWPAFLWRLYDRGPGTVEYHVFGHRGWIFWSVMAGLALFLAWIGVAISHPLCALWVFVAALGLIALSTRLFAQNWRETIRLAPLHVAVVFAVGIGILKGLAVNSIRWLRGDLKWMKSSASS